MEERWPLLELFLRLRREGLSLGIGNYMDAIRAWQAGLQLDDNDGLAWLCRTLWVKSQADYPLFRHYFDQVFAAPDTPAGDAGTGDIPPPGQGPARPEIAPARVEPSEPAPGQRGRPTQEPHPDEGQAGAAIRVRRAVGESWEAEYGSPPVTQQQIKQGWRALRRMLPQGPPQEVDLAATVAQVGRHGALIEPMLVPRRANLCRLLLLVDQDGSMVPFHHFTQRLAVTAERSGRLLGNGVYYFHDCPARYLYRDRFLVEGQSIADVLGGLERARTVALIVSDAGAARGYYQWRRVEQTEAFLAELMPHVGRAAWLNPVPQGRWLGTTADEIARLIPMFELSPQGWRGAIRLLNKPVRPAPPQRTEEEPGRSGRTGFPGLPDVHSRHEEGGIA